VKCQQISPAGHDQVGLAIQRNFEKFVVFGIAALADNAAYLDIAVERLVQP